MPEDTPSTPAPPRNVISVGALVVRERSLLVVQLAYGGSRGRYSLPGGRVDPGETLDMAAIREVREETSVEARPVGILGVRSRFDGRDNDNYVLWLMEHLNGVPTPDAREIERCEYLPVEDVHAREDVTDLVRYLAGRLLREDFTLHTYVDRHSEFPTRDPDSWRLFM